MDNLVVIFVVGFIAFFIYSVFSKSGKGRMFGGKIIESIDKSITSKKGMSKTKIKLHVIEKKKGENCVGIELSQSAVLAWSMTPITLTKSDAKLMIDMLNEAIDKT